MRINALFLYGLALSLVIIAAAGLMGSITLFTIGGGPVAMAAFLVSLVQIVAIGLALISTALPLVIILSFSFVLAFTAGYRYLRWTRFLGFFLNAGGCAYFLWYLGWGGFSVGFASALAAGAALFLFFPQKPNVRRTRRVVMVLQTVIFACVSLSFYPVLLEISAHYLAFGVITILIVLSYIFIYHRLYQICKPDPFQIHTRAFWVQFIMAGGASLLLAIIMPPLGFPALFALALVGAVAEMTYLYPDTQPQGKVQTVLVNILGQLPGSCSSEDQS